MKRPCKILVTGFGAFGDVVSNPTQRVVDHLEANPPGNFITSPIALPVSWKQMPSILRAQLHRDKWDAVLLMGVAASRPYWSVETMAVNRAAEIRDCNGQLPISTELVGGAPDRLQSTWAATKVALAIEALGVPVMQSEDAGSYLCNAALFLSLYWLQGAGIPVGFLHVPPDTDTMCIGEGIGSPTKFGFDSHVKVTEAVLSALAS